MRPRDDTLLLSDTDADGSAETDWRTGTPSLRFWKQRLSCARPLQMAVGTRWKRSAEYRPKYAARRAPDSHLLRAARRRPRVHVPSSALSMVVRFLCVVQVLYESVATSALWKQGRTKCPSLLLFVFQSPAHSQHLSNILQTRKASDSTSITVLFFARREARRAQSRRERYRRGRAPGKGALPLCRTRPRQTPRRRTCCAACS